MIIRDQDGAIHQDWAHIYSIDNLVIISGRDPIAECETEEQARDLLHSIWDALTDVGFADVQELMEDYE